jgi:hypothetical protein
MSICSPCQDRYWKEFFELKVHVNYLEIYVEHTEKTDKFISMFLAATSSGSICGWAIWTRYSFTWGLVIAISQLVNAIKIFLPYRNRLKALGNTLKELEELLVLCERKWFDVSEGLLSVGEINKLQFDIRDKKVKILNKYFMTTSLPANNKFFKKAKELANVYINNFYSQEQ